MDTVSFILASGLSDRELNARYGFDRSYWAHLRKGDRPASRNVALSIWRLDHKKVGPLAKLSDSDIDVLARLSQAMAPVPRRGRNADTSGSASAAARPPQPRRQGQGR
jgi:hypothetical protein